MTSISIDVDDPALYARARAPLPYQVHDTSKLHRAPRIRIFRFSAHVK
jgi:hypothetical protein